MNKLSFTEKNDLTIKYKSSQYFYKDLELFKKHYPYHPLNKDLAKANHFSYLVLDSKMLFDLLNIISIETILQNRINDNQSTDDDDNTVLDSDSNQSTDNTDTYVTVANNNQSTDDNQLKKAKNLDKKKDPSKKSSPK